MLKQPAGMVVGMEPRATLAVIARKKLPARTAKAVDAARARHRADMEVTASMVAMACTAGMVKTMHTSSSRT